MLETLLAGVRSACAAFPDKRRGNVTYSMADIGLSAFSLFFSKRGYRTLSGLLDAQSFFAGAQCHGMSSSMRLCGQPLTSRVSRSVK